MAAETARGDVLFFTESHCLPEPETLAHADAAARLNPDWAGFSCRSVPITHNLLSKIEAELYGRDIEFGMTEHPWRKVLDQCFVVRRSAYFQAGGFDPAFGHFAEWLIAARFHALGLTIGYTPDVRIHHVYIGQFGEWRRFTADFVEGQMKYLALEPGDPLRRCSMKCRSGRAATSCNATSRAGSAACCCTTCDVRSRSGAWAAPADGSRRCGTGTGACSDHGSCGQ